MNQRRLRNFAAATAPARVVLTGVLSLFAVLVPRALVAQAPGIPVLQSAFYNRGLAVGINAAGGGGSAIAGAVAYAPLAGQLVLVAGGGTVSYDHKSEATAGFRVAYRFRTFGADRQIGAAFFAGAGTTLGASNERVGRTPVGVSIAYRRALGETRALALYAAPYYDGTRVKRAGQPTTTGARFRSGVGLDVAVTSSIGAGLGIDVGGAGTPNTAIAAATQFAAGLSYHF